MGVRAPLSRGHAGARDHAPRPGGRGALLDCFISARASARRRTGRSLRVIEGVRGAVELELRVAPRFDYGAGEAVDPPPRAPTAQRDRRQRRAARLVRARAGGGSRPRAERGGSRSGPGDRVRLSLTYCPPELIDAGGYEEPDPRLARRGDRADRRLVAGVGRDAPPRTRRDEPAVRRSGARAQGAHARADRRDRRRADDVAARGARRRAQLGLPLRLGPGRELQLARVRRAGLRRTRPTPSAPSSCAPPPATPAISRSLYGVGGERRLRGSRARATSRATAARRPAASATTPPPSASSTPTASSST